MYLPVNTRDEGSPILAILGGMPETFFFVKVHLESTKDFLQTLKKDFLSGP